MSLSRPPLAVFCREEGHHLITAQRGLKAMFLIQPLLTQVGGFLITAGRGGNSAFPTPPPSRPLLILLSLERAGVSHHYSPYAFSHTSSVWRNRSPGSPCGLHCHHREWEGLLTLGEVKALYPTWRSLTPFQHECWAPRYSLKRMKIYIPYSAFARVSRDCGASFFPAVFAWSKALI